MPSGLQKRLVETLTATSWFYKALLAVRDLNISTAYIGAGAVRNAVWDALHGFQTPTALTDVDVVYFNDRDMSPDADHLIEHRLDSAYPDLPWEVTNQAAVHIWFEKYFGYPVEPLKSIEQAVATWPETAGCIAVRINSQHQIETIAPYGLEDLFNIIVRHNPARATYQTYLERIRTKHYDKRWPKVRIVLDVEEHMAPDRENQTHH